MDKSHKVSGVDGGVWSYSCPVLNGTPDLQFMMQMPEPLD